MRYNNKQLMEFSLTFTFRVQKLKFFLTFGILRYATALEVITDSMLMDKCRIAI
jgi:hypothetical protein